MTELQRFIDTFEKEYQTTLRVLRAFPPDQQGLKPSPKSMTALELAWIFASEMEMAIPGTIAGNLDFSKLRKAPATYAEALAGIERAHAAVMPLLRSATQEELDKTMQFYTAPRTMGPVRRMDVLWMFLHDQIHHRGQLSVYLRIAGGKVPSIYGPTADESWT
jgi:uncharacterized damage-inducible protein DinB